PPRPDDLLARLAGDEFVLVCERIGQRGAVRLAERLIAVLSEPFALAGGPAQVGASIGLTLHTAGGAGAEALLAEADAAMYQAKQRGGYAYEIYGVTLGARLQRRRQLEADLVDALQTGGLRLEYQPVVALEPRGTVGFEALLRWDHPDLGAISPVEAVSAAEATGTVGALGAWVLREACGQLARWNASAPAHDPLTMFVNVSARELLDPRMPARVAGILADTGVAAAQVVLEVTEHAALDVTGTGLQTLGALRLQGLRIALDDFGTGYSSLTHLQQVPFDFIKIDTSFTTDLDVAVDNRAIVAAIVSMAGHLGAQVVGEGIETAAQLDALRELGCALGQGWLLGRPRPAGVIGGAQLSGRPRRERDAVAASPSAHPPLHRHG
ncbi:MAG: GGDEF domain-containing phosphodiesterase, partial [Egibacteraceae bacterium]